MFTIDTNRTLGELVTQHAGLAKVLQQMHLDYCCQGQRTLDQACKEQGLDAETVARQLTSAVQAERAYSHGLDVRQMPLGELVNHIVDRYHRYARRNLPQLVDMAHKVAQVHGSRDVGARELEVEVQRLRTLMVAHLDREEEQLFPAIRLGTADPQFIRRQWEWLEPEHQAIGRTLERIRTLSRGFTTPAWGCTTYAALLTGLKDLEQDTLRHVHLENNVLMPRALE